MYLQSVIPFYIVVIIVSGRVHPYCTGFKLPTYAKGDSQETVQHLIRH